jgi:N-acetylglutamate synthase-like GNAT family acetyltransferase
MGEYTNSLLRIFEIVKSGIEKMRSMKMYYIRECRPSDLEKIENIVKTRLKKFYPRIEEWIEKKISDIESGVSDCNVAEIDEGDIAGFAITTKKEEDIVKLNTFFIDDGYQSVDYAIGPDLLYKVIIKLCNQNVKRVYVTFAEELFEKLSPFFERYGFLIDGISPARYRNNKFEVIMGKTFYHGEIDNSNFYNFIKKQLFEIRGYRITENGKDDFIAEESSSSFGQYGGHTKNKCFVRISTKPDIGESDVRGFAKSIPPEDNGILISFYGFKETPKVDGFTVLDANDIRSMFYPISLKIEKQDAFIVPVSFNWAKKILYYFGNRNNTISNGFQTYMVPRKLCNRPNKAVIRTLRGKQVHRGLRRGSTLIFYVHDKGVILGEAKVVNWGTGRPDEIYERYNKYTSERLEDLKLIASDGSKKKLDSSLSESEDEVIAIVFDWYQKYNNMLPLETIEGIDYKFIKNNKYSLYSIKDFSLLEKIKSHGNSKKPININKTKIRSSNLPKSQKI